MNIEVRYFVPLFWMIENRRVAALSFWREGKMEYVNLSLHWSVHMPTFYTQCMLCAVLLNDWKVHVLIWLCKWCIDQIRRSVMRSYAFDVSVRVSTMSKSDYHPILGPLSIRTHGFLVLCYCYCYALVERIHILTNILDEWLLFALNWNPFSVLISDMWNFRIHFTKQP